MEDPVPAVVTVDIRMDHDSDDDWKNDDRSLFSFDEDDDWSFQSVPEESFEEDMKAFALSILEEESPEDEEKAEEQEEEEEDNETNEKVLRAIQDTVMLEFLVDLCSSNEWRHTMYLQESLLVVGFALSTTTTHMIWLLQYMSLAKFRGSECRRQTKINMGIFCIL